MTLSRTYLLVVWTCVLLSGSHAFQPISKHIGSGIPISTRRTTTTHDSSTKLAAVRYETCANVGFKAVVAKPLGVVFGENPDPYYGLVVDDVAEGLNGGKAGLRVGDQLMAINGNVVVGKDFDTVMAMLQSASGKLDLVLYRGPVTTLFTILGNQLGEGEFVRDEDDDEGEEEVIMDENYESPVRIEVKEKKPLSAGDLFKAVGKVGKMIFEDNTPPEVKQQKKKQGFFGLGAETIQLDGDDANTLK